MLKILACIVGFCLLYLRFCLYENEEKRLQNYLVDLWLRIADGPDGQAKFVKRVLDGTTKLALATFDRLLGEKTWGIQSIVVSSAFICFSYFALGIVTVGPSFGVEADASIALVCLALGLLPAFLRHRSAIAFSAIPFAAFAAWYLVGFDLDYFLWSVLGISTSVAADVLFLGLQRRVLSWSIDSASLTRSLAAIIANLTVAGLGLFALSQLVAYSNELTSGIPVVAMERWFWLEWYALGSLIFFLNGRLFPVLIALAQSIVLIALILNLALWKIAERLVYACERFIIRERRVFGYVGGALVIYAAAGTWLEVLFKALGAKV